MLLNVASMSANQKSVVKYEKVLEFLGEFVIACLRLPRLSTFTTVSINRFTCLYNDLHLGLGITLSTLRRLKSTLFMEDL